MKLTALLRSFVLTTSLLIALFFVLLLQACEDNPSAVADDQFLEGDQPAEGDQLVIEDGIYDPLADFDELLRTDPLFTEGGGLPSPSLLQANPDGLGRSNKIAGVQSLTLPFTGIVSSSVPAFNLLQDGGGIGIRAEIRNPNSASIALDGVSAGTGHGLLAWNLGRGRAAVAITSNSTNTLPALDVSSQSLGILATSTSSPGIAAAADIRANNSTARAPALQVATLGRGNVLLANHRGTCSSSKAECNLALFQSSGVNKIRFGRGGKGFFNGGVQSSGADVAEAFEVEGLTAEYEPGDVLAISTETDRTVEKCSEPYSTLVAGVYATKPGVLLTERGIDEQIDDTVPMGVIGVIPTKVSAENGPIRRGDLLVSAGTPGHAMRGDQERLGYGMVLGKALENFKGPGTGKIRVLVTVR